MGDTERSGEPRWLTGRIQRVLLELSTVFYFFARNAAIPLVQQYVYHLVARKYNLTGLQSALQHDERTAARGQSEIIGYPTDDGLEQSQRLPAVSRKTVGTYIVHSNSVSR